ncbi:hypothetical protein LCGC14_1256700 [marine sediment metagenome]|uniref:Uncharacterized protein n=1 Tax=marine sediment metagenome TaxID=412755 RepID=A0A0F9L4N4_9ZZZZ
MQYLVELGLVEWLPGGGLRLVEKLAEVVAKIVEVLPTGYRFTDIWVERKKLKIIVDDSSSSLGISLPLPAVIAVIGAVVAALMPLLILIGIVIISWKLTEVVSGVVDLFTIIEKSKLIEAATEAGLTPDQINDMMKGVEKERISDVLKWVAIIGGITIVGVGGIIAFKQLKKVKA